MDVLMWMLADVLRGCRDDAPLVRGLYAGLPYSPVLAGCRKEGGSWSGASSRR